MDTSSIEMKDPLEGASSPIKSPVTDILSKTPQEINIITKVRRRGEKGGMRRMKKKRAKDVNSPKPPISDYLYFLQDCREKKRLENPNLRFKEVIRLLGIDWNKLTPEERLFYKNKSDEDRERFRREMEEYKKTDSFKTFFETQQNKKKEKVALKKMKFQEEEEEDENDVTLIEERTLIPDPEPPVEMDISNKSKLDIPIFNKDFLNYNKEKETELRKLRKLNLEMEEQNSVLEKHNETLMEAIEKLTTEINERKTDTQAAEDRVTLYQNVLLNGLASVPLPGSGLLPAEDNMDVYLSQLRSVMYEQPGENVDFLDNVKYIIKGLQFHE